MVSNAFPLSTGQRAFPALLRLRLRLKFPWAFLSWYALPRQPAVRKWNQSAHLLLLLPLLLPQLLLLLLLLLPQPLLLLLLPLLLLLLRGRCPVMSTRRGQQRAVSVHTTASATVSVLCDTTLHDPLIIMRLWGMPLWCGCTRSE
jgi:hypothetical protein